MKSVLITLLASAALTASAQVNIDFDAGVDANAGNSELAPHYILANRGGTVTQQYSALAHASLAHALDTTTRFSWGAKVELWGGWASKTDYYDFRIVPETAFGVPNHGVRPASFWLQQAFGEVKYRGVLLTVGAKHYGSPMVNGDLSSGDLVRSGNSRPMPGFQVGFVNFQNVPFTRGWVQIDGEIGYFKPGDGKWLEQHYNYYNHFITTGWWYNYKRAHLRSNPTKPLVVTFGMQAASQFGGTVTHYDKGIAVLTYKQKSDLEAFFKAFILSTGDKSTGDKFFVGNHLGTWDIALDYRLRNGTRLRAYHQHFAEDGSGIGLRNGFDGLWGLEYKAPKAQIVDGAVVELFDFTNQSGPIHWAPGDHEGTPLTRESTGGDDYYNNYAFNGYQNRGMSIGSPMAVAPIYNTDGYMQYADNRLRAFHAALTGQIAERLRYRAMVSTRKSWGSVFQPRQKAVTGTSWMVEASFAATPRLDVKAQVAADHGSLPGDNFGALLSINYHGNFSLGK